MYCTWHTMFHTLLINCYFSVVFAFLCFNFFRLDLIQKEETETMGGSILIAFSISSIMVLKY